MKEYYGAYVIEAIQSLSKDEGKESNADNSGKQQAPTRNGFGKMDNAKPPSANPTQESHE